MPQDDRLSQILQDRAARKKASAPPKEPSLWERIGGLPGALGTGIRIASGVASSPGKGKGALIGGAGEALAQMVEQPMRNYDALTSIPDVVRNLYSDNPEIQEATKQGFVQGTKPAAARIGVEAAMGSVPGSKMTAAGKGLESFGRSGAMAGVGSAMRDMAEGRDVDIQKAAWTTLGGGALGGIVGALMAPGRKAMDVASRLDAANAARKSSGQTPRIPGKPVPDKVTPIQTLPTDPREADKVGSVWAKEMDREAIGRAKAEQNHVNQAAKELDQLLRAGEKNDAINGARIAEELKLARIQTEMDEAGAVAQPPTFGDTLTAKDPSGTVSRMTTRFETDAQREAAEMAAALKAAKKKDPTTYDEGPAVPARPSSPVDGLVDAASDPRLDPRFQALNPAGRAAKDVAEGRVPTATKAPITERRHGELLKMFGGRRIDDASALPPTAARVADDLPPIAPEVPPQVAESIDDFDQLRATTHPSFYDDGFDNVDDFVDPQTLRQSTSPSFYDDGFDSLEDASWKLSPEMQQHDDLYAKIGNGTAAPAETATAEALHERLTRSTGDNADISQLERMLSGEVPSTSSPATFYKSPLDAAGQNYRAIKEALGVEPKLSETLSLDAKGRPITAERIAGKAARGEAAKLGLAPTKKGEAVTPPTAQPTTPPVQKFNGPEEVFNEQERIAQEYIRKMTGGDPEAMGQARNQATVRMLEEDLRAMEAAKKAAQPPITEGLEMPPASGSASRGQDVTPLLNRGLSKENLELARMLRGGKKVEAPTAPPQAESFADGPVVQAGHPGMVGKLPAKPKLVKPKAPIESFDDGPAIVDDAPVSTPVPPGASQPQSLGANRIKNLMTKGYSAQEIQDMGVEEGIKRASMSADEIRAMKAAEGVRKQNMDPSDETGRATYGALGQVLGAVGGGLAGAAMADDNPLLGGTIGALGGLGLASAPQILRSMGSTSPIVDKLDQEVSRVGIKETAQNLIKELPHVQRFMYLSSGHGLAANAIVGPYMSGLTSAVEMGLKGDKRGWDAAMRMLKMEPFQNVKESLAEAGQKMETAERRTLGRDPNMGDRLLSAPGQALTTGDLSVRRVLRNAGFSEEEAKVMTLTSEPGSTGSYVGKFGKAMTNLQRAGGPLGGIMLPFVRTPMNILEQGAERLPGIGALTQFFNGKTAREIGAEQLVSGATGLAAYGVGSIAGPDAKNVRRYVSNAGGRNALTANLGFLLGAEGQKVNPNRRAALARGVSNAGGLPQTDTIEDTVKFITGDLDSVPRGAYPAIFRELGDDADTLSDVPTNVPRSLSNIPIRRRGQ